MLGLAEGVVEVHRGGEDDRVAHFVEGIGDAIPFEGGEKFRRGLGDGFSRVGEVDVEVEGEVVAEIALLEEEVADALEVFLELGKVRFVGELAGKGEI